MGWLNDSVAAVWRAGHAVGGSFRRQAGTPGPSDDFWYTEVGQPNHAGVPVTPDVALKASALFAVVKVLAETMATMPLQMFRDLGERGREPAPEHPLDELIRFQPNSWQTAIEFWETMILHAVLRGTAYAEIVPGRRGAVDQLLPLHSDRMRVERLPDNSLRFQVTNPHTGERRVLLQEEVFRIPGLSSDGVCGLRVIDLAAEDIGLGMAADAYAARVFSNKLNVGGFLIHPGRLGEEAQKNLIQALMDRLAGISNAHRPIVLQEGMKWERASDTAKDSQLLEARKWQTTLIAQRFRVPLHMLGIDDQTNRSTVEAQAIDFVKYTLRPWVRRIEQAIRRDLIVAKGTFSAKYNLEGLLRGDSAARGTFWGIALGASGRAAFMTPNEVRVREGMNKSDDPRADVLGGVLPAETSALPTAQPPAANGTAQARADRLVAKEIAAIRKAARRFAGNADGFRDWVAAFYGGHVSEVMADMDLPKSAARTYCDFVRDEVLAANDLDGLLDRWADTRAAEIARTIKQAA